MFRYLPLFVVAVILLLGLGWWQLQRAQEKQQLEERYRSLAKRQPVNLAQNPQQGLSPLTPVLLEGHYDNDRLWLLDNRVFRGRVGYEALSPFVMPGDRLAIVNRGWWPGSPDRSELPEVSPVYGEHALYGQIDRGGGRLLLKQDVVTDGWPRRIQTENLSRMGRQLQLDYVPLLVRLGAGQPGTRPSQWQPITISSARHTGYAMTWFSLASVLCLVWIFSVLQNRRRPDNHA